MKKGNLAKSIFFCAFVSAAANAQEPQGVQVPVAEKKPQVTTEALFLDIMQSLPAGEQETVQEAVQVGGSDDTAAREHAAEQVKERRLEALEELPEELRAKVEKAIDNMDNRMKERQIQLKELQRHQEAEHR